MFGKIPCNQWRLCVANERRQKVRLALKAFSQAREAALKQQRALIQHNIVDRQLRGNCKPVLIAAAHTILEQPLIWSAPQNEQGSRLMRPLFANVYPQRALYPFRRVAMDSVLTEKEAQYFVHEAGDRYGGSLFDIDETFGDPSECSTARDDWAEHPLNDRICSRVCAQIHLHFGERRMLFLAGAHLRRTRPSKAPPLQECDNLVVRREQLL
eukprot:TRINITY_DN8066_c0_g1_i2.p1 TRINITY_DN8066_c0_g1~~TRINITY_DN8066_c0_g1_i2.p1  ORF type:complete len:212 (+),score=23.64 TRINITY_DN8066_c0_g1_i2:62-697(+)